MYYEQHDSSFIGYVHVEHGITLGIVKHLNLVQAIRIASTATYLDLQCLLQL